MLKRTFRTERIDLPAALIGIIGHQREGEVNGRIDLTRGKTVVSDRTQLSRISAEISR